MRRKRQIDSPEIPIAPMIDCVFLMLVYFMTTSSLERSEADLPCPVSQPGAATEPLPAIDEQLIALDEGGTVLWNGAHFHFIGDGPDMPALQQRLIAFRKTCELAGSDPSLRIHPEGEAPHQALVSLLDAVSRSGIESVQLP